MKSIRPTLKHNKLPEFVKRAVRNARRRAKYAANKKALQVAR